MKSAFGISDSIHSERGSASILCALLVVASLILYSTVGYQFVDINRDSPVHLAIILIFSIVGIFAIGCSLHLSSIGGQSLNAHTIRADLERDIESLGRLIDRTKTKVRALENNSIVHFAGLSQRGHSALALIRRIVCALETRYSDVKQLLSTGDKIDLLDAHEVFHRRLVVTESSLTSLIDADPIPAMAPEEWEPTLKRLDQEFDRELRRLEELEQDFKQVA